MNQSINQSINQSTQSENVELLSYTHQTDHKNNTRLLRDMEFSSRIQLAILLFVQFFLLYEHLTNMKKVS